MKTDEFHNIEMAFDQEFFAHFDKYAQISLLCIKEALKAEKETYSYFEIGSGIGNTLYTHLRDPFCEKALSLEKTELFEHSTKAMCKTLSKRLTEVSLQKLLCVDFDLEFCLENPLLDLEGKYDLFFIDSTHPMEALSLCLSNANYEAVFIMKSYTDIDNLIRKVKAHSNDFFAYPVPGNLLVLEKNSFIRRHFLIEELLEHYAYKMLEPSPKYTFWERLKRCFKPY